MEITLVEPAAVLGPPRRVLAKLALSLALVGIVGALTSSSAVAAWREATRSDTAAGLPGGTVLLTNDGAGSPMFTLPNLAPGDSATSYIRIGYGGSLPASVRLYGATGGAGLARFLHVRVVRGQGGEGSFVADATDYVGAGAGVVYDGDLAGFPDRFDKAIVDPGTWTTADQHTYRLTVLFRGSDAAHALSASQAFAWEARPVSP